MSQRLYDEVAQAIQSNPYLRGKTLRFEMCQDRLVLHGRVNSYFQKQMAQEAVRRIKGVLLIDNLLEVDWPTMEKKNVGGDTEGHDEALVTC